MHPKSDCPPLPELASLSIEGPDAAAFLQAQLTADVAAMPPDRWSPAAWCDPRGRVLAVMLVLPGPPTFLVALPGPVAEQVRTRMDMFRIGRKVTISVGKEAGPGGNGAPLAHDPDRRLGIPDSPPSEADRAAWWAAEVDAGMPWILPDTAGRFLPQMLGLERLGGLSYRKGCYPGQEVVARVHYRGRVTQRLARFELLGPAPGAGQALDLGDCAGTVLYAVDIRAAVPTSRGLMVVPANARPEPGGSGDSHSRTLRWALVEPNHAVLPSGP
ncbi:folate-binding protein YgfZ [Wenzhouxiangella sp. XN79A]|uniref:CAF17-like 4Fe-4S cluster assembly/insertion protein YgfZ n=1 Tax=Wenzhouxiangella sp. XN79A TaxID=2724193 RepID=UPI00144AF5EE|nr:folate-binding protein YgfZ [Wenzhouxiangella sp. XN79A]NKI35474.1 folate-binding protein YgfZ [Wenzhouxiangella sp. XN79A]